MKDIVFSTPIELKAHIAQHIMIQGNVNDPVGFAISCRTLHAVSRFQPFAENCGQHIDTSLAKFKNQFDGCILYNFWPQDNYKPI